MPVHTQVAAKDFLTILISLLKTRDTPEVQVKILYLIKKWGQRFEKQKDILPNFYEVFQTLKSNNVVFPENFESTYDKYVQSNNNNYSNDFNNNYNNNYNNNDSNYNNNNKNYNKSSKDNNNYEEQYQQDQVFSYSNGVSLDLNQDNYDKKYKKFVGELTILLDNITLANEMIDNSEGNVDEGIRTIIHNLHDLEKNLVSAIQDKIKHEKLLAICLGINDDMNRVKL